MLELLVVLVLMAIAGALVMPALRFPSASLSGNDAFAAGAEQRGLIQSPEVDRVLAAARRFALKRGEPVRLRVAADGAWAIVRANGGESIENGRVTAPLAWLPDMTVDAMGTCVLSGDVVPRAGAAAWDALACRWREARP